MNIPCLWCDIVPKKRKWCRMNLWEGKLKIMGFDFEPSRYRLKLWEISLFWVVIWGFSIITITTLIVFSFVTNTAKEKPEYSLMLFIGVLFWVCILFFAGYVPKRKRVEVCISIDLNEIEVIEDKKFRIKWENVILLEKRRYYSSRMVVHNIIAITYFHKKKGHAVISDDTTNETRILRISLDKYRKKKEMIKNIKQVANHYQICTDGF